MHATLARAAALALIAFAWAAPMPTLGATRQVNITQGSPAGWIPSEALEASARATAEAYLAAQDQGRAAEAYSMLSPGYRELRSADTYKTDLARFNARAGEVRERRITTITWTKDPENGPGPGVYVALDLVSRYARIDRHCGYVVLWQAPGRSTFQVLREEITFLDNSTAAGGKPGEAEAAWARISAACPNYTARDVSPLPASGPLPEASGSTIGYANTAAALVDLRKRSGVEWSQVQGWTVAFEEPTRTLWSFTPVGHPAHPAVVKRQLVEEDGAVQLQMAVHCEASKAACDALVREFQALNNAVGAAPRK